jgi:O-antigen ligase
MDRERLDRWLEHGILSVVCLILVAAPLLFGATRVIDFMWVQGLTSVALVLWMIRFWVRDEYRILWPPFAWAVLVFLAYISWRYTTADVEYIARLEVNKIFVYAAIFFLVLDNFNSKEWTQVIVCALIFVGMAMAMYAIYQFATGSRMIYNTPQPAAYHGRAGGPFVCPNHLADYIAMILPLAVALTLMARLNIVLKILIGYAAIMMLGGAFVTLSRAGCAALGLGLLALFAMLLFNRDFRLKAIIAIALVLIPALWLGSKSISAQYRMKKGFSETGFIDDRFYVWPAAIEMWRENYWTGVGPAHFDLRFRPYRPAMGQMQVRPEYVHNDYLNILTDYGLAGLALVAAAMAAFWIGVVRIWRYVRRSGDLGSRQSTRAAIVLGASSGLLAVMAHCLVDFNIHIPALAIAISTLLAIVSAQWRFATERFWVRPKIAGRIVGSLTCAVLAGWLGFNAARTAAEQRLLIRAEQTSDPQSYRALLHRALALEPNHSQTAYDIGASLRTESWNAVGDYRAQAIEAMKWFEKAYALDPYTPHPLIGIGMCLDFLDRKQEAWPYFRKAMEIDRYNYWICGAYGWHLMQYQAWASAAKWLSLSLGLKPNNPLALPYFKLANQKFEEQKLPIELSKPLPTPEQPAAGDAQKPAVTSQSGNQ